MQDLQTLLAGLGCRDVRTYIQSGNVVLTHKLKQGQKLATMIRKSVLETFQFETDVIVMPLTSLQLASDNNPFPAAKTDPKTLHLFFLAASAIDFSPHELARYRAKDEAFELQDLVFYLYTPAGFGRSKLAAKVEKSLGVPATARNLRTVQKVLQLAD